MSKVKKEEMENRKLTEEILKELQTDIVFTPIFTSRSEPTGDRACERADYIHHFEDNIIPKVIQLAQKKTKKLMYDYYFKKFKNPVIIEKKEFERLGGLNETKRRKNET